MNDEATTHDETPRIFFAMPVGGTIEPHTEHCLELVKNDLRARGWKYYGNREKRGSLPLAHALLSEEMLRTDATHMLIVHADVSGFTPEDVVRMASSGEDLIIGPIPGRNFEPQRIANALAAGVPPERAWAQASTPLFWELPGDAPADFVKGHLLEVLGGSTGFMMISRKCLDAVGQISRQIKWGNLELFYNFEEAISEDGQLVSEDLSFCARWRHLGGKVYADVYTSLLHHGRATFHTEPLALSLRARPKVGAARTISLHARTEMQIPQSCEGEARTIFAGLYELPVSVASGDTVLDLGANVGAFTRWAQMRWPGVDLVCYEPQMGPIADALLENTRGTLAKVEHVAVVPNATEKELTFFVLDANPCSSSLFPQHEGGRPVSVRCVDAADMPDAAIVKVDVEGREPEILDRYFAAKPRSTVGVIAEWHTEEDHGKLASVLESRGFRVIYDRSSSPDRPGLGVMKAVRDGHASQAHT